MIFREIERVDWPDRVASDEAFEVVLFVDGEVPFAQCILRQEGGREWIAKDDRAEVREDRVVFHIPAGIAVEGELYLQVEGCRNPDFMEAEPHEWVTVHGTLRVDPPASESPRTGPADLPVTAPPPERSEEEGAPSSPGPSGPPRATVGRSREPVIYFGIHKHMHQPYYRAADPDYLDGQIEEIFCTRAGPYTGFLPQAVWQYIHGGLAHAGLSTSWSGSLVEQLDRFAREGRCGGAFSDWNRGLRELASERTALGHPRVEFTAFGYFHPLMPLIPARDVVGQITWHRDLLRERFGIESTDILFPPETAFQPHMIPALNEAGIRAVLFDTVHLFRACANYPFAGREEGMLPPNEADQENHPVDDWLQLHNIWAPGKVSPSLLKPCRIVYTDPDGTRHQTIGVPAERYLGNEDARGGYGALQYESVMGQLLDGLVQSGTYDPDHPPFFVLHSDGDNHGGGAESYYGHNTGQLVAMCNTDRRFQLLAIKDYLESFPVDPSNIVHVEAGSWAGADNGDPLFAKWFSRDNEDYSPDLNSWAVLTALQNAVHALEDANADEALVGEAKRLLYTAETSCYWYWTGQEVWDRQVTEAANRVYELAGSALEGLRAKENDPTPPTLFTPWVRPMNPGGLDWGPHGELVEAPAAATVRTFVHDLAGVEAVVLHWCEVGGPWRELPMRDAGPYPCRTGARETSRLYTAELPEGAGNLRFFVEATDGGGRTSRSALLRVFVRPR